jgi:hypothetical protein
MNGFYGDRIARNNRSGKENIRSIGQMVHLSYHLRESKKPGCHHPAFSKGGEESVNLH